MCPTENTRAKFRGLARRFSFFIRRSHRSRYQNLELIECFQSRHQSNFFELQIMANLLRRQHFGIFAVGQRIIGGGGANKTTSTLSTLGSTYQHIRLRQFHNNLILNKIVAYNLSDIGEGIKEVVVKEWFVKEGDAVQQFDNICEVQSDKASVTITSRFDGKITKLYYKVDDIALVGKPLVEIDAVEEEGDSSSGSSSSSSSDSDSSDDEKKSVDKSVEINEAEEERQRILATPAVRRIAMENKVNLSQVRATGKQGRVLKGDILEFLNLIPPQAPQKSVVASIPIPKLPTDRVEMLKGVPKAMFKSMTESAKIPHMGFKDEIDMGALIEVRNTVKQTAESRGVKLSFLPFLIKAASLALAEYPILNSSVDVEKESVIYHSAHNISVAMDTPLGLVVPNIKNVQNKSIISIAKELNALQERGQKGQLRPDDFANGTFSLSNIGVIGGTYLHPCILAPQVVIGAVGQTKALPRFGPNDEIIKAHIMAVSWSADHRVIDGITIAKFSNFWKSILENPNLFLILDGE